MENYIYKNPTEIIFGRNRLHALKDQLLKRGYRSALVLYGGSHWKENGTLEQITTQLESCSISYFVQGGIRPNPKLSEVEQIVRNVKGDIVDVILALGGGSVIDTAKAVAVCLAVPSVRLQDILLEDQKIKQALDVGVISTIAGSGSESSCSMVITIDEGNLKRACDDEQLYPVFAILDPILTFTLPYYQMVSGACDILMHAMERYFSPTDNTELIDSMCEGLMRVVISSIEKSIKNPQDYEARANLMWAGSLCHNGLLGTGRKEDWACHRMEHELSGLFNVVHGAGLCALWGSWAAYVRPYHPKRFASFARQVMGIEEVNDDRCGTLGIQALVSFFKRVGMPVCITDLNVCIDEAIIQTMAQNCLLRSDSIGQLKRLSLQDIKAIYRKAGKVE